MENIKDLYILTHTRSKVSVFHDQSQQEVLRIYLRKKTSPTPPGYEGMHELLKPEGINGRYQQLCTPHSRVSLTEQYLD